MRGQTAVEYLLVFSTMLVLFASITIAQMINPAKDAANDTLYLSQARSATDAIAGAIDTVYANGSGAVKSVSVKMDVSWSLVLDNADNRVKIMVMTSTGNENVEDNLRYEIDNYHSRSDIPAGTYTVIAEWTENNAMLEGIDDNDISDKKIRIYIMPRGG